MKKNSITINRSKHKFSVVDWWYLRLSLMSIASIVLLVIVLFIIDKSIFISPRPVILCAIVSCFFWTFYSFINKGNLVDSVTIDYNNQEIRVRYYSLLKKEYNETFPFEGFSWSILRGGKSQNRLRFQHEQRSKIVLCEDSLGWTLEDCNKLHQALSRVTPREKGLFTI